MEARVFSVIHELLSSVSQTVGSPAQEPPELVKTLLEERATIRKQLEEVGVEVSDIMMRSCTSDFVLISVINLLPVLTNLPLMTLVRVLISSVHGILRPIKLKYSQLM